MLRDAWGKDSHDKYDYEYNINRIQIMDIILIYLYGHFL